MPPDDAVPRATPPDAAAWSTELRAALSTLDPTQRRVLRLAYGERRTQAQIAEQLQLPRSVVSRSLATGLQALARVVGGPTAL